MSQKDLDQYQVTWRKPVEGQYKDLRIVSMPPPSSGGVHIIQMLNILASDPLYHMGAHSPKAVHITASAMQMAFADRAEFLGDADFVDVPWRGLASLKYARALRKKIFVHQKNPSTKIKHGDPKNYQLAYESDETTHFTIMDGEGNTVSSTQTVNLPLGSAVVAEGTGIVLNNEMDDFSAKPGSPNSYGVIGGKRNAIAPGKRPLSSMTPTIVLKKNKPVLALGSPAGPRIINCVLQTILNYFEHELPLYESVAAVRYHHQWYPDVLRVDEKKLPAKTEKELEALGYEIKHEDLNCYVQAVANDGKEKPLHAVSDPRGQGAALAI